MPVTILPTFAALRDPTQADVDRHGEGDPLTPRIPWVDVHSPEEALRTLLRMAGQAGSWSGPLIIGNPSGDLDSAENEAATVAALLGVTPLVREQATVERVLGALDHADIIHLATHAWFDADDPLDSAIELADGTIKARDLVKAHSRAKLVVLSACESAASQRLVGGEVAGLAHALLRAGSQAVVAGLWLVEDAAGAFLMEAFYREWLENGDPAVSLSRAQRLTSEQLSWQHPYFWSGFILLRSA